ncbi:MAG: hypothetical protein ACREXU_08520 [Gammaproteobacteria bacterium]
MTVPIMHHAGPMTFGPEGTLFVADNTIGTIFAVETGQDTTALGGPLEVDHIDARVGETLGAAASDVTINALAVHPASRDVYFSVSRRDEFGFRPAVVKLDRRGMPTALDLAALPCSAHEIANVPDSTQQFRSRAGDWPVPAAGKYHAKAQLPMRALTVVAMVHYEGELFVSGISNEEFSSTLRRVRYPFDGTSAESQIRIYHTSHGRYETRAPIRAMQILTIDGEPTVVAAYTCSPIVLLPVADLRDGAQVTGRTIGDMGNGQPLHMVVYQWQGQDHLFVTNAARGPQVIPVAGLQRALAYTPENAPAPRMSDLSPQMPLGPVGKTVMFVGAALHLALLDEHFFVAVVRDARTGALHLESLPTGPLPIRLDQIWSEFDFPPPPATAPV